MNLPGTVQPASSGMLGFDADSVISQSAAQEFFSQNYSFCARYLSLGAGQDPGDLSSQEAQYILGSGLALMAIQHAPDPGWSPTYCLGLEYGLNAATNAKSLGFPPGVNVWCDLEQVSDSASSQDVIAYCNAWYTAVSAVGYVPGLYVGAGAVLSGQELYGLQFQHYWRSISVVPEIPTRGYQVIQTPGQQDVNGIGIDKDTTQTDNENGQALWLVTANLGRVTGG